MKKKKKKDQLRKKIKNRPKSRTKSKSRRKSRQASAETVDTPVVENSETPSDAPIEITDENAPEPTSEEAPDEGMVPSTEQAPGEGMEPMVEEVSGGEMERMSEVILDFAAPLLTTCKDETSEKNAVSLAIFVWNATLLSEEERTQTLEGYLSNCKAVIPPEEFETLTSYVDMLIERKKTHFSENRKKITGCTFSGFGQNRQIEVGYLLE